MIPNYPGSKTGSGLVQRIVSLMPRHDRYIEPFVGGGVILESKRPARSTIAADRDPAVIEAHGAIDGVHFQVADALDLLPSLKLTRADLVYLDPPYHLSTRGRQRLYRFEMDDVAHRRLLRWCIEAKANVMLSGYRCPLYDEMLKDWHRADFGTMTRGGPRVESVWCNFTPGVTFHDTRFLGGDFRGRERIKRKRARWLSRFLAMEAADRAVVWEALEDAASTLAAAIDGRGDTADRGGTRAERSSSSRTALRPGNSSMTAMGAGEHRRNGRVRPSSIGNRQGRR